MRSPTIPYPGAKGRLAPTLVSMMPQKGGTYVEPFAGRGNVFFAAADMGLDFDEWILNDISTAPFFTAIEEIGDSVRVPERTREEYARLARRFKIGNQRAIVLEPYITFSGGGYKNAGYGGMRSATAEGYARTLRRCVEIMKRTRPVVMGRDWKGLRLETLGSSDFVFFDPPYYGADVRAYKSIAFDYKAMIELLVSAKFRWMLTEYRQDFYVRAFGEPCYVKPVQLACDGLGTRMREECVWKNF